MAILSHPEPLFNEAHIRPAQPGEEDIVLGPLAEALHGSIVEASHNGHHASRQTPSKHRSL